MARYRLTTSDVIFDTERQLFIPINENNIDYQQYLVWLTMGSPPNVPDPDPTLLDDYKKRARYEIDFHAEGARTRYITNGAGQAMTYQEKSEEAADYVAAGYPAIASPVDYPFVYADSVAFGITPQESADAILAQKSAWIAVGAQVEQVRLSGKNAVTVAIDESEVDTAKDATIAQLNAI